MFPHNAIADYTNDHFVHVANTIEVEAVLYICCISSCLLLGSCACSILI